MPDNRACFRALWRVPTATLGLPRASSFAVAAAAIRSFSSARATRPPHFPVRDAQYLCRLIQSFAVAAASTSSPNARSQPSNNRAASLRPQLPASRPKRNVSAAAAAARTLHISNSAANAAEVCFDSRLYLVTISPHVLTCALLGARYSFTAKATGESRRTCFHVLPRPPR